MKWFSPSQHNYNTSVSSLHISITILASQAKSINLCNDLKTTVMKCYANIYFNQQCLAEKVIPNYTKIKIQYTTPATDFTKKILKLHFLKEMGKKFM